MMFNWLKEAEPIPAMDVLWVCVGEEGLTGVWKLRRVCRRYWQLSYRLSSRLFTMVHVAVGTVKDGGGRGGEGRDSREVEE